MALRRFNALQILLKLFKGFNCFVFHIFTVSSKFTTIFQQFFSLGPQNSSPGPLQRIPNTKSNGKCSVNRKLCVVKAKFKMFQIEHAHDNLFYYLYARKKIFLLLPFYTLSIHWAEHISHSISSKKRRKKRKIPFPFKTLIHMGWGCG